MLTEKLEAGTAWERGYTFASPAKTENTASPINEGFHLFLAGVVT